ncbi:protein-tyrosine phosphatase family protein [Streptomyces sp. 6N223]|uniref:protein-tyrosine phosphatase family protein n=1 Tax=Streptomyces sp. 6N223 TaxID=3457412 RepID=UPI003FD05633
MRARNRGRDAPEPRAPWDEITPGLWMGGHRWADDDGGVRPVVVRAEFDLVISLFTRPGHGPPDGVEHLVAEMPDDPLTARQIDRVRELARTAASASRAGRVTLVRCQYGYNRSGLVVAQTLIELGMDAASAIDLIRRRRSPWALHNLIFEQYLRTGLDIAALLAGLEER